MAPSRTLLISPACADWYRSCIPAFTLRVFQFRPFLLRILPSLLLTVLSRDCNGPLISYHFQFSFVGSYFVEFMVNYSIRLWLKVDESYSMLQQTILQNCEELAVASFLRDSYLICLTPSLPLNVCGCTLSVSSHAQGRSICARVRT